MNKYAPHTARFGALPARGSLRSPLGPLASLAAAGAIQSPLPDARSLRSLARQLRFAALATHATKMHALYKHKKLNALYMHA